METLKERYRKTQIETVNLLRRVQNAHEDANRIPELERELEAAKERIGKLELDNAQATELTKQAMSQCEPGWNPASATDFLIRLRRAGVANLGKGPVNPKDWETLPGIQTEQRIQKSCSDELLQSYSLLRDSARGLQKDLGKTAGTNRTPSGRKIGGKMRGVGISTR